MINSRSFRGPHLRILQFALAWLILFSQLNVGGLHRLFHVHSGEDITHSESDERDPCHISIFHPGSGTGNHCHHSSHISKQGFHCSVCEAVLPQQPSKKQDSIEILLFQNTTCFISWKKSWAIKEVGIHGLLNKGPPRSVSI